MNHTTIFRKLGLAVGLLLRTGSSKCSRKQVPTCLHRIQKDCGSKKGMEAYRFRASMVKARI